MRHYSVYTYCTYINYKLSSLNIGQYIFIFIIDIKNLINFFLNFQRYILIEDRREQSDL